MVNPLSKESVGQFEAFVPTLSLEPLLFTPAKLMQEGVGEAEEYLRKKYHEHWCAVAVAHNQESRKLLQRRRSFFSAKW